LIVVVTAHIYLEEGNKTKGKELLQLADDQYSTSFFISPASEFYYHFTEHTDVHVD
jgi:hypothetical protein